tara:strand:- start:65 stop:280 length:216 start_codon:yes stop_codon:yes gene_type:complete
MEIFGFLVLCALNAGMSFICVLLFLFGGFEISNIFTSESKFDIAWWCFISSLNIYWWFCLVDSSPFKIVMT